MPFVKVVETVCPTVDITIGASPMITGISAIILCPLDATAIIATLPLVSAY